MNSDDPRLHYPATARNRDAILGLLREVLPHSGIVLEIGSGSGEHTAYFAPQFPDLAWQPSDLDTRLQASIAAHAEASGAANIRPALLLDVTQMPWPISAADAIFSANMIHIAPWRVALALLQGAGQCLRPDGCLILYGPFMRHGRHTAPSNDAFDRSLRQQDPEWGVRDLETVEEAAAEHALGLDRIEEMPANNLGVVFRKRNPA